MPLSNYERKRIIALSNLSGGIQLTALFKGSFRLKAIIQQDILSAIPLLDIERWVRLMINHNFGRPKSVTEEKYAS